MHGVCNAIFGAKDAMHGVNNPKYGGFEPNASSKAFQLQSVLHFKERVFKLRKETKKRQSKDWRSVLIYLDLLNS